jgi:hypothetical protein
MKPGIQFRVISRMICGLKNYTSAGFQQRIRVFPLELTIVPFFIVPNPIIFAR